MSYYPNIFDRNSRISCFLLCKTFTKVDELFKLHHTLSFASLESLIGNSRGNSIGCDFQVKLAKKQVEGRLYPYIRMARLVFRALSGFL